MIISTDQIGKTIRLSRPATRIVCLVPSITEYLYDLGLEKETLGITKFCIHPDSWFRTKTRVGGTKNIHFYKIADLQPDLVIASKEENVKEQVEALETFCPVWTSDVHNFQSALIMMNEIGKLTDREKTADGITGEITRRFATLLPAESSLRTAYLIWKKPYMAVGGDCFIHDILSRCGFKNIFSDSSRYPVTNITELKNRQAELILLSSEPYPFTQKHIEEMEQEIQDATIILVDGEMFSWYGSRMMQSPEYFTGLISTLSAKFREI